ncbi:cellulase family glycosylhydrolase [Streptomyces scopuliridis]
MSPAAGPTAGAGFVHAKDGSLFDELDRPLRLRGVGLGNWMLPEGYMWRFPGQASSPREIEALVSGLVGGERAVRFWTDFRDRFITEADIARIAAEGFNHVRLPINWRTVMDESGEPLSDGYELLDRLVGWCRAHGLWVLLDLHGAPGGQTGTNIDDSPRRRPELFEQPRYRELTLRVWTLLAQRYADEPTVCGYDLLNEPLPDAYQHRYADRLAELYRELTAAIRAVDPHHLIVYEGTHWATNWAIFTEVWDPNSMLQFHKYWSPPDLPSIRPYLDTGDRLGLPVYMGEGGENDLDWLQTAFQLYDDCGISWNFWPWKKLDTTTSPCSAELPPGWDDVTAWAAGRGPKPSADQAWDTLTGLLDRVSLDRCLYRTEVVNAVLRRAPLRLPATGFSFLGEGESYATAQGRPLPYFRSDDSVTVRRRDGSPKKVDFSRGAQAEFVVELDPGDWVTYEVNIDRPARLEISVRATGHVVARLDDMEILADGAGAGGPLPAGRHKLRVTAVTPTALSAAIVREAGPVGETGEG